MGSLRTIQADANRLRSTERREAEREILYKRTLDLGFALYWALDHNDLTLATSLLEDNRDIIAEIGWQWVLNKTLKAAILRDHRELVRMYLRFTDINHIEEKTGKTPIIYAVLSGNPGMVKLLLDAGADPNRRKGRQKTALFHARKLKQEKIVSLLIAAGAKE